MAVAAKPPDMIAPCDESGDTETNVELRIVQQEYMLTSAASGNEVLAM